MASSKLIVAEPLEKQLWRAADKLRKNIDAAQYKHVVLGLIFLRYISVSFEQLYDKLVKQQADGADPEDREEYAAENVFYVPVGRILFPWRRIHKLESTLTMRWMPLNEKTSL